MKKIYEKALKKLPGTKKRNQEYRDYIAKSIEDFVSENPDATEEDVKESIGSAEQVRAAFIDGLSEEELAAGERERKKKRSIKTAVLVIVFIPVFFFSGRFLYRYFNPEIDIVISRPVNPDAQYYIEKPSVGFSDTALGISARKKYQIEAYWAQAQAIFYKLYTVYGKYESCQIYCRVEVRDGATFTTWYGTAVNQDGKTEQVREEYAVAFVLDKAPEE